MDNKFTVTFGQLPSSYINREHVSENIYNDFCLDDSVDKSEPYTHLFIYLLVRLFLF